MRVWSLHIHITSPDAVGALDFIPCRVDVRHLLICPRDHFLGEALCAKEVRMVLLGLRDRCVYAGLDPFGSNDGYVAVLTISSTLPL